jgi:hypothetical protein
MIEWLTFLRIGEVPASRQMRIFEGNIKQTPEKSHVELGTGFT